MMDFVQAKKVLATNRCQDKESLAPSTHRRTAKFTRLILKFQPFQRL